MFIVTFDDVDALAEAIGFPDYDSKEQLIAAARDIFPSLTEVTTDSTGTEDTND